jgi:hypothetical protein
VIFTSKCRVLEKEAIATYFKSLRFDAAGTSGARTCNLSDAKPKHYH